MSGGAAAGWLSRCGPVSLLAAALLVVPGAAGIQGISGALLCTAVILVALAAMAIPPGVPPIRLLPAVVAVLSVGWSNWFLAAQRSVADAATSGLRVGYFVLPSLVFLSYLDPSTVGDHLAQRLRLPVRPVLAVVAALHRLDSLGADWAELARTRRARGLGPGRGPLSRARYASAMTFALLVQAIRQAGRMTVAMEARGYSATAAGGRARSWAEPAPWTRYDTLLCLLAVALAALPWVVRLQLG